MKGIKIFTGIASLETHLLEHVETLGVVWIGESLFSPCNATERCLVPSAIDEIKCGRVNKPTLISKHILTPR